MNRPDLGQLTAHVERLAGDIGERNFRRYVELLEAAGYIQRVFREAGYSVESQDYTADGETYSNLEVELPGSSEIVVVGAHYDTFQGSPGADDNGTAVAALLELARCFRHRQTQKTLRFVAFVNEEPPFYLTEDMGSLRYARRARERTWRS